MTTSHGNSWHVRASIGTELGPIDTETLLTMAESGLLCDADVVCAVNHSDWRPLPTVLGELRSVQTSRSPSMTEAKTSEPKPELVVDQPPSRVAVAPPVADREHNPPVRSRPLPGWKNSSSPATARPMLLKQESTRGVNQHAASAVDPKSESALLETWKDQRREAIDRLLAKVAEREASAILESDASVEARDETSLDFDDPVLPDSDASETNLALGSHPPKQESFVEMRDRWRRSLPTWPVVTAAVLIVGLLITYWPVSISQSRTVARFQAMYVKLERLRRHPQDRTGMEDFSQAAVAELNGLIPKLRERADGRDQDSKVLLWMARDCLLPILKTPRNRDSKPERDLLMLFAAWDKRHQTTYAVMPDPEEP